MNFMKSAGFSSIAECAKENERIGAIASVYESASY